MVAHHTTEEHASVAARVRPQKGFHAGRFCSQGNRMTAADANSRVNAWDYKDVQRQYGAGVDTADSALQDLVVRCIEPTGARGQFEPTGTHLFANEFYPRSVRRKMTQQRLTYLQELDNDRYPFLYELTHRGFGKTTLAIIACARRLGIRASAFLLFTSSEYKIASRRTDSIRGAFMRKKFQDTFGRVEPRRNQRSMTVFSEDAFTLVDPRTDLPFAMVSPRGANQAVNGSIAQLGNNEFRRPDLIVNDDGQSRKNIWNSNVRERYEEWIEAELFQTVDVDVQPGSDGVWHTDNTPGWRAPWRIWVVDTCKHRHAHIMRLQKEPHWHGNSFPLAREIEPGVYKSMTGLMDDDQVQALYMRLRNKPDYWAREFLCRPSSGESCIYTEGMFDYFRVRDMKRAKRNLVKFLIVDPARTGHHRASRTSILAVAVDVEGGCIYLLKNVSDHMDPAEYYAAIFRVAQETGTTEIWVEETGLSGVIRNAIQQAASQYGVSGSVYFRWLRSQRSPGVDYGSGEDAIKRARASAMHPYYVQRLVKHEESLRGSRLEQMLLEYPECTDWDETDTLGYIPEILETKHIILDGTGEEMIFDEDEDQEYELAGEYFASEAWMN